MPDPTPIHAFFSYARSTWEANPEQMPVLFKKLEAQCIDQVGKGFTKWQDQERLKWGHDWAEKIEQAIAESHLFVLFLSSAWLESETCRKEFEHFLAREKTLSGKRVFVIEVGPLDAADKKKHKEILTALKERQNKSWSKALFAKTRKLTELCRDAAFEIKQVLAEGQNRSPQTLAPSMPSIEPAFGVPLVEGDLYIPPVGQRGDETLPVAGYGHLTFAGWCRIATSQGPLVLGIRNAILHLEATGVAGRLALHEAFQQSEKPCQFNRVGGRRHTMHCQITSLNGEPLKGNVLASDPCEAHVPLVSIHEVAPKDRASVGLRGSLSIDPQCFFQPPEGGNQQVIAMQEAVLSVLMAEYGTITLGEEDKL